MDFSYTEAQESFRHELRDWLEENLPDGWLENPEIPSDREERNAFFKEWQQTLAADNWAGIHWPEAYGGRGASLIEQTIYREEMARVNAPPQINLIGVNLIGPTLIEVGTEEQKERFVPNILSAEEIWCQGYSEPESGSDVASLTTKAEKDGDEWVINGQKIWTSYAHIADWCFLVARTDSSGTKHEGLTAFLVDMDQDGISTEPIHQANDDRTFNQVYFDDAVTTDDLVVGEVDEGWDVVMTLSAFEHGMTSIYSIEQEYLDLLEYCQEETRGGTPLIEDDNVRRQLADLDARIQAAKMTHYRNVSTQMETGTPGPEASMDLVVSDELRKDLLNFAVDIKGPAAALWDNEHEAVDETSGYIRSYGSWIAAGTGDIQRNIIGEQVLGLPKDIKSKTSHRGE
ncbi:acyl-CoA dehydrogenase [Salinadaptatus halalkaliphilus]|uniref:Acyl-CoA dehydrogenase n=1 Tax=Salinadaptatus halalkaliphilus TaxID=2419781 RepID=A0A4S3TL94_9EURY|nr:acyl-CoA dehydrogenase family protein [Salinadaptatus halalkaliphilus]THE64013.1 acyl-CoA dehydrogenase [Salinadaptatus halalkaliphilus]